MGYRHPALLHNVALQLGYNGQEKTLFSEAQTEIDIIKRLKTV